MEIAKNVRDFLTRGDPPTPDEERLLARVQDLHERFLVVMDDFNVQVSTWALSMRPEARMMSHKVRLSLYQDWRARLMERVSPPTSASSPTTSPNPNRASKPVAHVPGCVAATCLCELVARLDGYKLVLAEYLEASSKASASPVAPSPEAISRHLGDLGGMLLELPGLHS